MIDKELWGIAIKQNRDTSNNLVLQTEGINY